MFSKHSEGKKRFRGDNIGDLKDTPLCLTEVRINRWGRRIVGWRVSGNVKARLRIDKVGVVTTVGDRGAGIAGQRGVIMGGYH